MRLGRWLLAIALVVTASTAWADLESGLGAHERGDHRLALWDWLLAGFDGSAPAQFNVGTVYYNGEVGPPDYARAAEWYRRAAAQRHVGAQYLLGLMYHTGRGVPQDSAAALRWFRLAAAQGHARAQHNVGVLYRTGRGVPRDLPEAARWFLRAAEQGYVSAQVRAAVMYDEGEGVAPDPVRAYAWYALALERLGGVERTELEGLMRALRARMSDAEVAAAERRARAWRPSPEGVDRAAPVWPRAFSPGPPSPGARSGGAGPPG